MSMTREEETQIIQAVLAGDANRFEALVLAFQNGLYSYTLRMLGSEQDALDATQEAFLRAYRGLPAFRGESRFSSWLYKLAGNVCIDMLRRRPGTPELSLTDEERAELAVPDDRPGPEESLERKELRRAVHEAMDKLTYEFREALILRDISGLSYEEIAEAVDVEIGTVKSRIFRARTKLAEILREDGNFSSLSSSFTSVASIAAKGGEDA